MNIYVGNMPYAMSADELKAAFAAYGNVTSVRLVTDRETGRAKGFGFVEMPEAGEANAAIEGLNGTMQGGRALVVNEALAARDVAVSAEAPAVKDAAVSAVPAVKDAAASAVPARRISKS